MSTQDTPQWRQDWDEAVHVIANHAGYGAVRDADRTISEANDHILSLEALVKELKSDAERYRHLVATCNIDFAPEEPWQLVIWEPNTGEDWKAKLDEAIDLSITHNAAMQHAQQGGEDD